MGNVAVFAELIMLIVYACLIVAGTLFGAKAFRAKTNFARTAWATGSVIFFAFFSWMVVSKTNAKRNAELERAGTYHLTAYPNCNSCKAVLHEDNTYDIITRDSILAKGNWHFAMGGDYLIIYLNGEKNQMGNGDYQYDSFIHRQGKVFKSY